MSLYTPRAILILGLYKRRRWKHEWKLCNDTMRYIAQSLADAERSQRKKHVAHLSQNYAATTVLCGKYVYKIKACPFYASLRVVPARSGIPFCSRGGLHAFGQDFTKKAQRLSTSYCRKGYFEYDDNSLGIDCAFIELPQEGTQVYGSCDGNRKNINYWKYAGYENIPLYNGAEIFGEHFSIIAINRQYYISAICTSNLRIAREVADVEMSQRAKNIAEPNSNKRNYRIISDLNNFLLLSGDLILIGDESVWITLEFMQYKIAPYECDYVRNSVGFIKCPGCTRIINVDCDDSWFLSATVFMIDNVWHCRNCQTRIEDQNVFNLHCSSVKM